MGPPVRLVCVACLHSLEISDHEAAEADCPYCGRKVESNPAGLEPPTPGEGFACTPPRPDDPTSKIATSAQPATGKIGRFVLREPLGEGGYGQVFRAYDPHLDRDVALKILKSNRLGEKSLERFYREARAAARLDHPHIVGLHDAGRDEGRCWIAYQLVSGRTLSMIRDYDRPSIDTAVRIVRDLALALDHAHGRGVFHRDLKPANVLIDDSGRARLTDFGLARRGDVDSELTVEGTVLGTPHYMSPEAAAGRAHEADARSDVYSLGVILYELICGRRPADVPSDAPLWRSTRITTPPTPRSVSRTIPVALDRICMKALAFDPEARHPNARSLADALSQYLVKRPAPKPDPVPVALQKTNRKTVATVVAALVVCLALGMGWHVANNREEVVDSAGLVPEIATVLAPSMPSVPPVSPPTIEPTIVTEPTPQNPPAKSPETTHVVLKPVIEPVVPRPKVLGDTLVVGIKGIKADRRFHRAVQGCPTIKKIERESPGRIDPLGDFRAAFALAGFSHCKSCFPNLQPDDIDKSDLN